MAVSTAIATTQPIYGPVDASHKEFRLLRILPGSKSSPIRCVLAKHYMPEAPEFLALSYTWGQPDPNCHIEVNSCSLGVTKNLLRFLMQARRMPDYANRYFWIDAVCVDQSNTDERGQQIGLMASIYASATLVILWLGPAYADSDIAMRAIAKIGPNLSSHYNSTGETEVVDVGMALQDGRLKKIWRNRTGLPIRWLCERRYWTRLWVLQELVLAREIRVLCGGQQIRWTDLEVLMLSSCESMSGRREDTKHNYESCMGSPCRAMISQVAATNGPSSLYDQVLAAQHLRCSDLRDRVYGLLGIAKIVPQVQAVADYSLSLVHALHVVIQQDCATRPASTLLEVRRRCQMLADVFGVAIDDVLSFRDVPTANAEYLVLHEETSISLQWALRLKLGSVIDLWYAEFGMAEALQIAIQEKASAATGAILDRWQDLWEKSTSQRSYHYSTSTWLHVAAQCGNDEAVRSLLDRGMICLECRYNCQHKRLIPLNYHDRYGLTALHHAILNRQKAVTEILLDINAVNLEGTTSHPPALVVAAAMATRDSDQDLMRILMARSDINEETKCRKWRVPFLDSLDNNEPKYGITPLIAAIKANWMPAMRTLLSGTQIDKHTQATMAMTALLWAVDEGVNVLTSLLWHEDVDVHALYSDDKILLHAAHAWKEDAAIGSLSIAATNEYIGSPLHLAAYRNYTESAALLLKNGANISAKDRFGRTPLHCAAERGSLETVARLLENGADISAEDYTGTTPLHSAAEFGKANTAALLLKNGADISAEDYVGKRPLHSAAEWGDAEIVALLLENGANISAEDHIGELALHSAAKSGNAQIVALLLKNGADATAKTNHDETPLHHAMKSELCRRDVLTTLAQHGAEVNAKDHYEQDPLHYFLERDYPKWQITESVETLLELGADPNAQDVDGMRPGDGPKYWESCHDEARQILEAARGSQKSTSEG